jgi:hypothetical protein
MGYGLHLEFDTNDEFEITVEYPLTVVLRSHWTGEPVSGSCANALIPLLLSPVRGMK